MKYAQLVIGPAGSGKSTYCHTVQAHCQTTGRTVHVINLDPAAEAFQYNVSSDIRDLVGLDDVMEELSLGPNGGLVYCMEFLLENMDWLEEELGDFEDDYVLFDCPGQIELFSHFTYMRQLVDTLQRWDYRVCAVYLLDAQFVADTAKFFAGALSAMAAMVRLEVPHVNVLTKCDLLGKRAQRPDMDRYLLADASLITRDANASMHERFFRLNHALANLMDEWGMVSFHTLDREDPDSVSVLLATIDNAIQFGEDAEPKERSFEDAEEDDGE